MTTLQRDFSDTASRLSTRVPIAVTPGLIKINLDLVFCLDHRDGLGKGFHQFGMGKHNSAT